MDMHQLKELIDAIKALPKPEVPEPTIFSIGGRGYFENPTTDILAFFCNSEEVHGLNQLVNEALFDVVCKIASDNKIHNITDFHSTSEPQREVPTNNGARIDLLIEGNEWVMVIENKIFHNQNNPFKDYEDYITSDKDDKFKDKIPIFILLSPDGTAPQGWLPISYAEFLSSLKSKLADAFINQPLNKWIVLLREFILHMESIVSEPNIALETKNFILSHLAEIKEVENVKNKTIKAYQNELTIKLQKIMPDEDIISKVYHWSGYPALYFYCSSHYSEIDETNVVLYLHGNKNEKFYVVYYAYGADDDHKRQQADEILKVDDTDEKIWLEANGRIRGYKTFIEDLSDDDKVVSVLRDKLQLVDKYEKSLRSHWK